MYCLFKNNIQSFKKQLTDEDLGVLVKGLQKDQVDNVSVLCPWGTPQHFRTVCLGCGCSFTSLIKGTSTARN